MATAFKCDRCGDLKIGTSKGKVTFTPDPITENYSAELCQTCINEFNYWRRNVVRAVEAPRG